MGKITNIHDKFIRAILGDKSIAVDYFRSSLPSFISDRLDFSSLTQLPGSYLSKELKETMSDIVYACTTKHEGLEVKVSLLIEHKSYRDKNAPVQIGSYIFSALQQQLDDKEKLSLVIPVLFYHGNDSWNYTTLADLFENLPLEWKSFVPDFDYVYNDLSSMPDEELNALSNQFLAASLLTLKHYMEDSWLDEHAVRIFNQVGNAPGNLLEQFAVYFLNNTKSNNARIIEILDSVPDTIKEKIMSTLDIFEKKGLEKGLKKGLLEGLQEGARKTRTEIVSNLIKVSTLTDEQIASAANVSVTFVADIRAGRSQG